MNKILKILFVLIVVVSNQSVFAQYTVEDGMKKGATDAFLNSWDAVKNAREQKKLREKQMREKDPSWSPPKELGVPYLGFEAGWSRFRGEHVGLKAVVMGFNLFGGVGKEWIFKNHADKNLLWYAGCGYFFGDIYDGSLETSLDITVGQTPVCHDIGIIGSMSMGYYFGESKRFGVKGTLGLGGGNLDKDDIKFIWEVGAGIIIKIFAD